MSTKDSQPNETDSHVSPNTEEAVRFLRQYDPKGPWHLVSFAPDQGPTVLTLNLHQVDDLRSFIDGRQRLKNLYFHVNSLKAGVINRKARKSDVHQAIAAHVDIDDLDGLERLRRFRLRPTAVVFSGGGYHAYWKYREPVSDLEHAENINKWIVQQLGGDRAATDVSRIMRLPGTINLPNKKKRAAGREPVLAEVVQELTDWERRYAPNDFGVFEDPDQNSLNRPGKVQSGVLDSAVAVVELPSDLSPRLLQLARNGDDAERPRSGPKPRYASRSEAVFAVACGLARNGKSVREIAGVLVNPSLRISESILEKKNPKSEAIRQAEKATLKVGDNWPDGFAIKSSIPRRTFANTKVAVMRSGLRFWFDEFRQRYFVQGHMVQSFQGELNDRAVLHIRDFINQKHGFDPGKDLTRDAIEQLCSENFVDPVCEFLASLEWDREERLETWLINFAGSEDTPYVRAVSSIALIAAVRRARQPGVKFDTIPVLEGVQGSGKSTLIRIMASDEFFSDQDILALDAKAQMEALEGIWLFELCELAGMKHTDINKLKAFASRSVDRARPAYARYLEPRPRRGILIGTTNDEEYLKDQTGNRRFWPIRTGGIDLDGLRQIRLQIWAEAACKEANGASIELPKDLWLAASKEQSLRLETDGWENLLEDVKGEVFEGRELLSSRKLLEHHLEIPTHFIKRYHWPMLKRAMRSLGWTGPETLTFKDGSKRKGYWRQTSDPCLGPLKLCQSWLSFGGEIDGAETVFG